MRIIAFAAPMQHQVEARNYAEAITCERTEPANLILRDGERGHPGIGFDDLLRGQGAHSFLSGFDPTVLIGEETDPAQVEQRWTNRGNFPVDERNRPLGIE